MPPVDREIGRFRLLLRDKIRERGFTFLEIQEVLGWGKSYISQLLTDQKRLRMDQVLCILTVIGIEPAEFFRDLYATPRRPAAKPPAGHLDPAARELAALGGTLRSVALLLVEKGVIEVQDLADAVAAADRQLRSARGRVAR